MDIKNPMSLTINYKVVSVVTYLRCGGVVNSHIEKGLLLSLRVIFLIGEYLAKLQARAWLSHALSSCFSSVLARRAKCMRHVFADIYVLQDSEATYKRCGGIFNIHLTTNLPRNLLVNFFVQIGQDFTELWL